MVVQIGGRLGRAAAVEVFGRRVDMIAHGHEVALNQVRLARRPHADGEVGLAHGQVQLAIVEDQAEGQVGVKLDELPNTRRQPQGAEGDRGGDLEGTLGTLAAVPQAGLGHRQPGHDVAGDPGQDLSLFGQDQAPGVTMKEDHAQGVLQGADLTADRGLAQVEPFARMGEAAGLGDGMKDAQLVPVHDVAPARRPAGRGLDRPSPTVRPRPPPIPFAKREKLPLPARPCSPYRRRSPLGGRSCPGRRRRQRPRERWSPCCRAR